jgi:hypothetical protein
VRRRNTRKNRLRSFVRLRRTIRLLSRPFKVPTQSGLSGTPVAESRSCVQPHGEATYAVMVKPGEEILVGNGRRFRVLDVVPFVDETDTFVGMLKVEAS